MSSHTDTGQPPHEPTTHAANERYVQRISLFHRIDHGALMASFLGLAATGLPLKFNQADWARPWAHLLGGFGAILALHKLCALLLTAVFTAHLGYVGYFVFVRKRYDMLWGPRSMVPRPKDFLDLAHNFAWFFGLRKKPRFDRFTYWEKFDYWAVFWGMAIIGGSGYVMWFAPFFAHFLPGRLFNIALIIHSEEALLAVWFIFTIHFFNGHLRPEMFPMDLVIFTGRISESELQEERPVEFERLEGTDGLQRIATNPPYRWLRNFGHMVGFTVVTLGFVLFVLTLLAI